MTAEDLDKPADLTVWPGKMPARTASSFTFATLREAFEAAAHAIDEQDAQPWIITDGGEILPPNWIRAHAPTSRSH